MTLLTIIFKSTVELLLWGHPFCGRNVASPEGFASRQGGLLKGVPLYVVIMKEK